jgi:class 3 adenylate cyclase
MPNLKQLINIKEKYSGANAYVKGAEIKSLVEAFDPKRIVKGFTSTAPKIQKYIDYFKERRRVNVVLLFVDVTSFSISFNTKTSDQIASFLDSYYERVIPTICAYGGEIEKIIGDGIICVFGEPFISSGKEDLHRKAEECATEIVRSLKGTIYESKIALHYGEIMYYQNKSDEYYEFTMIGNALTDLFRLESVSHSNSINFYAKTFYEEMNETDVANQKISLGLSTATPQWTLMQREEIKLKGVRYNAIRRLQKS